MAVNQLIDLAKTPAENILDLLQLNAKAGVTLTPADFSYAVTPLGEADVDGRNTTLVATSLEAGQFDEGATVSFTLKRPALPATATYTANVVAATAAEIKTAIAAQLKVHESELIGLDDVIDHPNAAQTVELSLSVAAGSLLYTGTSAVTVNYIVPEPDPENAFDSTELDGFELSL